MQPGGEKTDTPKHWALDAFSTTLLTRALYSSVSNPLVCHTTRANSQATAPQGCQAGTIVTALQSKPPANN